MAKELVNSTCGMCHMACGILIHLADGNPVRITGDPDSPINRGILCVKGEAGLQLLYHPDRLKHPVKRVGERGEGKWQKVSWDEALDTVAAELKKAKDQYGVESVAFIRGAAKGLQEDYMTRFANLFGSPNISSMAHLCFVPRKNASLLTYGYLARPDYEYPPSCLILWGTSPFDTCVGDFGKINEALGRSTKLIVIDPRKNRLVDGAEIWLQLRPGSDLALALGMINFIVNGELYDKNFVSKWTVGFDELKSHVGNFSPEKVAEITWVPAETIRATARLYAMNRPACIQWGNGIDQGINSFQSARAICILRAITGNLGVPGGELKWSPLPILARHSPEISMVDRISPELRKRRVSAKENLLPIAFYALPQDIVKAILNNDPYPIRVGYVQGCNPVISLNNSKKIYEALNKLDFLVVADMFMTPTAALADVVLPVASFLECDGILPLPYYEIASVQQRVGQVGESRSDYDILRDLAKKMGLGEYFWEDITQVLDVIVAPAGITFDEARKIGVIAGSKLYRQYEKEGFKTESGKVELYSSRLKEWGFDPLPIYYENPETPYSDAELAKEYPLIFTNWKLDSYRHTGGREIRTLRGLHPEPVVHIHPETARGLHISNGDWVYIETKRGRIKQKAFFSGDIDPRVVGVDFGWWFPERRDSDMYGWRESNLNILTNDEPPFNKEMGSPILRGIVCKVYKAN
ncbi:MAG: molybdopterin-dependent oxidoreductase [Pseudomonadota bacterium]